MLDRADPRILSRSSIDYAKANAMVVDIVEATKKDKDGGKERERERE